MEGIKDGKFWCGKAGRDFHILQCFEVDLKGWDPQICQGNDDPMGFSRQEYWSGVPSLLKSSTITVLLSVSPFVFVNNYFQYLGVFHLNCYTFTFRIFIFHSLMFYIFTDIPY